MVYRERDEEAPGSALFSLRSGAARAGAFWGPPRWQEEDYGPPHPEDGGYDVAWPAVPHPAPAGDLPHTETKHAETFPSGTKGPDEHEEFSAAVAETVNDKGPLPEKPRVSDLPPISFPRLASTNAP